MKVKCGTCGNSLVFYHGNLGVYVDDCCKCFPKPEKPKRNKAAIRHDEGFAQQHPITPEQADNGTWKVFSPILCITWGHPTQRSAIEQAIRNLELLIK